MLRMRGGEKVLLRLGIIVRGKGAIVLRIISLLRKNEIYMVDFYGVGVLREGGGGGREGVTDSLKVVLSLLPNCFRKLRVN